MKGGDADLHLHTTASDGTQRIAELAGRAVLFGLSTIAITDHDTISPELTERVGEIQGVEVITGVEIKVDFDGVRGELLGYFTDPRAPLLQELFSFMQRARRERMAEMVERCRDRAGLDITAEEVGALAAGSVGRPHLAQLLVERGVVGSMREAFDRLLAKGRPCYVALDKPGFRQGAAAVHAAGGVTSIAHPCLMEVGDWEGFLARVHPEGVDGVEAFYPYELARSRLHVLPAELTRLAREEGLLLTGGSDDHGPGSVKEAFGAMRVSIQYVDALKRACGLIP